MRHILTPIAIAFAGVGLLAGARVSEPEQLHETVRTRVLAQVGASETAGPETLRGVLAQDPGFAPLLAVLTRKSLALRRGDEEASDALQEALLRIWRSRPEVFLLPHDEVLRYVRTAVRHNCASEYRRGHRDGSPALMDPVDLEAVAKAEGSEPSTELEERDLLETLEGRLDAHDLEVLKARLGGAWSERDLAAATGLSRHAVISATERIERELGTLLAA